MSENDAKKYDAAMRPDESKDAGLAWHSPKTTPFHLAGLAWFATDGVYRRMPLHPKRPLPEAVDRLANHTAGAQIRFQTDSARVSVRVRLANVASMNHMPCTGQCGFDSYIGLPGDLHYCRTTKFDQKKQSYECSLFDSAGPGLRNFTLNFPLYIGVEEVEVGLDAGAQVLAPPPYAIPGRVVAYGTSITQGGCAARPGMAWTNALSRRLNVEFINLGFSGSGQGEPEVAETVAGIAAPACFILDYEANCVSTERLKQTFPEFLRILRAAHPKVPILAISGLRSAGERFIPDRLSMRLERLEFERGTIEALRGAGDQRVFFQDGGELLGEDYEECTVDGGHPTDLGFMRIANGLTPVVRGILGL